MVVSPEKTIRPQLWRSAALESCVWFRKNVLSPPTNTQKIRFKITSQKLKAWPTVLRESTPLLKNVKPFAVVASDFSCNRLLNKLQHYACMHVLVCVCDCTKVRMCARACVNVDVTFNWAIIFWDKRIGWIFSRTPEEKKVRIGKYNFYKYKHWMKERINVIHCLSWCPHIDKRNQFSCFSNSDECHLLIFLVFRNHWISSVFLDFPNTDECRLGFRYRWISSIFSDFHQRNINVMYWFSLCPAIAVYHIRPFYMSLYRWTLSVIVFGAKEFHGYESKFLHHSCLLSCIISAQGINDLQWIFIA